MKITTKRKDYDDVMALPRPKHRKPLRQLRLLNWVIRVASIPALHKARFSFDTERMELVGDQPCLILMNHSCFLDMKMAFRILGSKPFNIVCTTDAMVGKGWLMRLIGAIPTQKFVTDLTLVQDISYALKELKSSVLMYPEAGYSFDGTATRLPRKMGVLLKKLDVPVVMVTTEGAFSREPLYNNLQKRKVKVSAHVKCLFTRQELKEKSVQQLGDELDQAFSFDSFAWQRENGIEIREDFRADGLNRILYKCPHCGKEGQMEGEGIHLRCHGCGKEYELTTLGVMRALSGETEFPHIPDWFRWQREQVRREILAGTYRMDADVKIGMMVDHKALYMVGEGRLTHDRNGFRLTGCDGRLEYTQKPLGCYSLNADYWWYEIGDVISIGNQDGLYYCFPQGADVVCKTRLAAEELYTLTKSKQLPPSAAE